MNCYGDCWDCTEEGCPPESMCSDDCQKKCGDCMKCHSKPATEKPMPPTASTTECYRDENGACKGPMDEGKPKPPAQTETCDAAHPMRGPHTQTPPSPIPQDPCFDKCPAHCHTGMCAEGCGCMMDNPPCKPEDDTKCDKGCFKDCTNCYKCMANPPQMHPATTASHADPCFN